MSMMSTFHATDKDFLVSVSSLDGYWSTCTGGEPDAANGHSWDGGATRPVITVGRPVFAALVVSRPYDPARDSAVERRLQPLIGRGGRTARFNVTRQALDGDGVTIGEPKVWTDAVLVKVRGPQPNSDSGTTAMIELTFMPNQVT